MFSNDNVCNTNVFKSNIFNSFGFMDRGEEICWRESYTGGKQKEKTTNRVR